MQAEILRLSTDLADLGGIWGLARDDRHIFAATTRYRPASRAGPYEPSHLLVLDGRSLDQVSRYTLQRGRDVHSLHFWGNVLYAVSTGTDELLALTIKDGSVVDEQVAWRPDPDGPREDRHHLNAVTTVAGELAVSGFGRKDGILWSTATDGFVVGISTGSRLVSGLHHPHSPLDLGSDVAYCESGLGAVRAVQSGRVQKLGGYARGLCMVGDQLFVGTSLGRRVSRSLGVMTNRGEPGATVGQCAVSRLRASDLSVEASVELGRYAQEIYDLLPVDGTQAWPRLAEGEWQEDALRGARTAYEEAYVGLGWLHAEVAQRDAAIQALHHEVTKRDSTIKWLHDEVAQRDATVEWLHSEVAERDATAAQLHNEVAQRDATLEWLHREVAARDSTIEQLHREVASRDAMIATRRV
ncbi:MAG: DUF4915 domain-containing protein [Chloroflexota bacterium]